MTSAMQTTTPTVPADVLDRARALARGSYQRSLLDGYARWSGADLRGAAKRWSGRYAASRSGLLSRLRKAGLDVAVRYVTTSNNRQAVALCLAGVPVSAVP